MLSELSLCGGASVDIAFVLHLEVVEGEEKLGQFWRTSQSPGGWGMYGPSNYTYLKPGWNVYSRVVTDSGSLTPSAEPPADFAWRFLR